MKRRAIVVGSLVSVALATGAADARSKAFRYLNPAKLDPVLGRLLSKRDRRTLDAAFAEQALHPTATAATMRAGAPGPTIRDPETGAAVDVRAAVARSIAIQRAWHARTGASLAVGDGSAARPVDLNALAKAPPQKGSFRVTGPVRVPIVMATRDFGTGDCPEPPEGRDVGSALARAWKAVGAYRAKPADVAICSLPFGGLVRGAARGVVLSSLPRASTWTFGDRKTALGTFTATPNFIQSQDGFSADLDTTFRVALLRGAYDRTLVDGSARITVPDSDLGSPKRIAATVSVSGDAFPNSSSFTTTRSLGDGTLDYVGAPTRDFTFFDFARTFVVVPPPFPLRIRITMALVGKTSLSYTVDGGADGLFAIAKPHVDARAVAIASADALITRSDIEAKVTVQDGTSEIATLMTVVPYAGGRYAVERLYTSYAPAHYRATIKGRIRYGFGWLKFAIMDTGDRPVSVRNFVDDSGWSVRKLP